jgi:hypothetical protein
MHTMNALFSKFGRPRKEPTMALDNAEVDDELDNLVVEDLAIDDEASGDPLYLCVGSIAGASKADVRALMSHMIASQCVYPALVKTRLAKDKTRNRWLYEIHEGGPGRSVLGPLLAGDTAPRTYRLTDGRCSVVEEHDGDVVTLTHQDRPDLFEQAQPLPADGAPVTPFESGDKPLLHAGRAVFAAGALSLVVAYGGGIALLGGITAGMLPNPYLQPAVNQLNVELADGLASARAALAQSEDLLAHVAYVKKEGGVWSHQIIESDTSLRTRPDAPSQAGPTVGPGARVPRS